MEILFHGAGREIGKSCIELQSQGQRYILDAGIKFVGGGIQYPQYLESIEDIDAVFLSHAHLDHSGALAFFERKRLGSPIYSTELTWTITRMLLEDTRHLEQLRRVRPTFSAKDIDRVEQDVVYVEYDKRYQTEDGRISFRFLNSGHIPGGVSVIFELEGKKVLYTSDINTQETRLMMSSVVPTQCPEVDVLIIEGTYGARSHPDRKSTEEGFIKSIRTCMEGGGSALIPVFGVGRSQEVLMVLNALRGEYPIYLDGMARGLLDETLRSDDPYIRGNEVLREMASYVKKVQRHDRERLLKEKNAIIVSTSGMVEGGPSTFYARSFIEKKENFIILTGYQANGTQGRSLYDDHVFFENGEPIPAQCHIRKFSFSAHLDQGALHNFIKSVKHKDLILQHGDTDSLDALSAYAVENLPSTKVHVPHVGETIHI